MCYNTGAKYLLINDFCERLEARFQQRKIKAYFTSFRAPVHKHARHNQFLSIIGHNIVDPRSVAWQQASEQTSVLSAIYFRLRR